MAFSPRLSPEKKHWWLSNRKMIEKYTREAETLISTQSPSSITHAITLLDAALSLSPRHDATLELKARCLLFLRRFKEIADMLRDHIPSFKPDEDDSSVSLSSEDSAGSVRSRTRLIEGEEKGRCFGVWELRRRVLGRSREGEGQWRYTVLGQACCHLGMMEDAMVLLQTGKRLAMAVSRRESLDLHDDDFLSLSAPAATSTSLETTTNLLNHVKLLLRRKAAAVASLDAGLPSDAIRHFSKILDSRRGIPHAFAAACYVSRAAANRAAGRPADALADCNRALALDPSSIAALRARADVLAAVKLFPDCLRDLDHLKLLYDAVLRDGKLPGPVWRPHEDVRFSEIAACRRTLTVRIQEFRSRGATGGGESGNVDYYALIGVRRGCKRSELERAQLLLSLRHRPEKAAAFVDRLEFADENRDIDAVRDQARMSALILYRILQKGYSSIMANIVADEENTVSVGSGRRGCKGLLSQIGRPMAVNYEGLSCG